MAGLSANAPSPEGWQQAKPLIERLYVQQDRPLKEVRAYLAEHRNFLATERMFKQRLKEWSFDRKKVKAAEWRYMLKVTRRRRRDGKDSAFRVNGKVIVWSNIRKHLKRKKKTEDEFLSAGPEAEAVEDVVCYTPPGSPRLSMTQPASAQVFVAAHSSSYASLSPIQTTTEQWRAPFSSYSHSPDRDQRASRDASFPTCSSASWSSECSGISDPELQSIALRPINVKSLPPLDQEAALRISRLMSGSQNRSVPVVPWGSLPRHLGMTPVGNQTGSESDLGTLWVSDSGYFELCFSAEDQLSDEDMASRWVVYYFQACIYDSQGDQKSMQEHVNHASKVFKSMLRRLNPYLLTGLTLMTSTLYFHDHAELLKQFLEDSCQVIEKVFSRCHPIIVPYRYMLMSVRGDQPKETSMTQELDYAYKAFQLTWGKVHSNTLTALYYYGCSLLDGDNFDEAEAELLKCYQLSERNLGPSHFLTVWTLATISRTLFTSNRAREVEAVGYLEAAISRCRRMMHQEHPYYLELNRKLATIHHKLNNLAEVESLYRIVLAGRIKVLGLDREFTRASVNDLYEVLMARNKHQEAADLRADISAMEKRGEGHTWRGIIC